jgi:hypothetical protein
MHHFIRPAMHPPIIRHCTNGPSVNAAAVWPSMHSTVLRRPSMGHPITRRPSNHPCVVHPSIHLPPMHMRVHDCLSSVSMQHDDLLKMESLILSTLGFRIMTPTTFGFLSLMQQGLNLGQKVCHLASYLLVSCPIHATGATTTKGCS